MKNDTAKSPKTSKRHTSPQIPYRPVTASDRLFRSAIMRELPEIMPAPEVTPKNTGNLFDYPKVSVPKREYPISKKMRVPVRRMGYHHTLGLPEWFIKARSKRDVTNVEFAYWRKNYLQIKTCEAATLFRVSESTIFRWESGAVPIPFIYRYMMDISLTDPNIWLSRHGFADLYIEYRDGEHWLCSTLYPDIRFTHSHLLFYERVIQKNDELEIKVRFSVDPLKKRIAELEAENCRLKEQIERDYQLRKFQEESQKDASTLNESRHADVHVFPVQRIHGEPEPVKRNAA